MFFILSVVCLLIRCCSDRPLGGLTTNKPLCLHDRLNSTALSGTYSCALHGYGIAVDPTHVAVGNPALLRNIKQDVKMHLMYIFGNVRAH